MAAARDGRRRGAARHADPGVRRPCPAAPAALAWYAYKRKDARAADGRARKRRRRPQAAPKEEPISTALALDLLRVELGYGLLPLINDVQGHRITDQIKALRRQLAQEMGFVMPAVRILDNMQLGANEYRIRIKEMDSGKGELFPGSFLIMDPKGAAHRPARHAHDRAGLRPARHLGRRQRCAKRPAFRGFTVVDPGTVLTTHLTEVLKSHMAELLSYAETKKLLDDLPPEHKKLVEELIPSQISVTGVQRVLQTLLAERVSIRDLPAILEGIAEAVGHTKNALYITEHVRARLARQLCHANLAPGGYLPLIALSPALGAGLRGIALSARARSASSPWRRRSCSNSSSRCAKRFDEAGGKNEVPVLLTSPQIRPFVRSIIERFRPQTVVMSQNEIHASVRLRTLGQV